MLSLRGDALRGRAAGTSGVLLLPVCSKSHLLEAHRCACCSVDTRGEERLMIYCQVVLDYAYAAVSPLHITAVCRAASFYGF